MSWHPHFIQLFGHPGKDLGEVGAGVKHPSVHFLFQTRSTPELQSALFSDLQNFPNPSVLMMHLPHLLGLGKQVEDTEY